MRKSMEKIRKMFTKDVSLYGVGEYIPQHMLTSDDIEERIRSGNKYIDFQKGIVYAISGTYTRYFAPAGVEASDLAIEASRKALQNASMHIDDIDCILFASASHDITEPATANIVQS